MSPLVVTLAGPPTGSTPHVSPKCSKSILISCLPCTHISSTRNPHQRDRLTFPNTHATLSAPTAHVYSLLSPSSVRACSVCTVWSSRPLSPPERMSWCSFPPAASSCFTSETMHFPRSVESWSGSWMMGTFCARRGMSLLWRGGAERGGVRARRRTPVRAV